MVRPSPGAAYTEGATTLKFSKVFWHFHVAAPEDGRTPSWSCIPPSPQQLVTIRHQLASADMGGFQLRCAAGFKGRSESFPVKAWCSRDFLNTANAASFCSWNAVNRSEGRFKHGHTCCWKTAFACQAL